MEPAEIWRRALAVPSARPVVLLDGGSGAGKTTLAAALAAAAPLAGLQVVTVDTWCPGWDGLARASELLVADVLRPVDPGFVRWDWERDRPGAWQPIDPARPLLVEGCGALTPASRARATFGIWLDVDAAVRKRVALARDGGAFDPYWDRWAAQEAAHWRRDRPADLADLVLTGPGDAEVWGSGC